MQLDDSTAAKPSFTYTAPGNYTVTLRVGDGRGGFDTTTVAISIRDAVRRSTTPPRAGPSTSG